MAKIKRFTACIMVVAMVASALLALIPTSFAAVDGSAFYDEDYSGTAADFWIDISATGTSFSSSSYREYVFFDFMFYGTNFDEVTMNRYGVLAMGHDPTYSSNLNFPSSSSSADFVIAPFWDYLTHANGAIYYEIIGTKLIVQYQNMAYYYSSGHRGDYTFQVILDNSDNTIRFNYLSMNPYPYSTWYYESPTVGLNSDDGVEYEEYYYDSSTAGGMGEGNYPVTGTTILYLPYEPPSGVEISGPSEIDEGEEGIFSGTISGYGVAVGDPGYDVDDTGIEPYIDATGGVNLIPLLEGEYSYSLLLDDGAAEVNLPFPFEFYGIEYPAGHPISVCVNGFLDFGTGDRWDEYNDNIPTTTTYSPNNAIYPFWDDLRFPPSGGGIYMDVGVSGGHAYMVIQWVGLGHYQSNAPDYVQGSVDFEVILWDNNVIDFRYNDVVFEPTPVWDRNDWHRYTSTSYDPPGSTGAYAMVYYSPVESQDEHLITPQISVSGESTVTLEYGTYYNDYTGTTDTGTVDVSFDGGPWTNVVTYVGSDVTAEESFNIATGGASNMQVRFRYIGNNDWYWTVDNVRVTGSTELFFEDFNSAWGTYGDNPPAGWTIIDNGGVGGSYLADYGDSATVGVENIDGTEAEKYSYNDPFILPGMNIRFTWEYFSGTGYQWVMDGDVLDSGPVTSDPFYTSLAKTFPDGPAASSVELIATFDGSPLDAAIHPVTVNNVAPDIRDYSSPDNPDLGEDSWIHGYVDDVPADTITTTLSVSGTEGVDWVLLPHASTTYDYTLDLYAIRAGTYTVTVTAEDDDGGMATEDFDIIFSVPMGALDITDVDIMPGHVQAGGMTMVYADVVSLMPGEFEVEGQLGGATINPGSNYDSNMLETLTLSGYIAGDMVITFQNDIETGWDGWHVKADGTIIHPVEGYDDPTIVGLSNDPGNTGHDSAPRTQTFPLPGSWSTIDIIFGSDSSVTYPGPVLDEITLGATTYDFDTTLAPWTGTSGWGVQPYIPGILVPAIEVELTMDDWDLDLPEGWEMLKMHGSGMISSGETMTLVAALSIPPGTPIGDYEIGVDVPYVLPPAWPGDLGAGDDTEHYIDDIGFDFPFYINAQPSPPPSGDIWWCGDDALGTYSPNALDSLVFQVTLGAGEQLSIQHDMDGFNTWDGGNLQVWDGTSWQLVYPDSGYMYDDTSISGLDSPYADAPGWSDSYGLLTSYFDLGSGTHDVRLVFGSTSVVEYRGWLIYSVMAGSTDITNTGVPTNLNPGASEWHQIGAPPSGGGGGPYGGTFRDITISSNGVIELGSETYISLTNYGPFPSSSTYADYKIAPFWEDMAPQNGGSVSYNNDGSRAIITWFGVPRYSNSGTYSFQCILYPNGDIQFNYLTMQEGTTDDTPTVGVNLGDGTHGNNYYHETTTSEIGTRPTDETSIMFTYDGEEYIATEIPFEWVDFRPKYTISVMEKMKANDLSYYRHSQNAMKKTIVLAMNLQNNMVEDDGSMDSALDCIRDENFGDALNIATSASAGGKEYGYWVNEGGYAYFLNPGKNGNGMAGFSGSEAVD